MSASAPTIYLLDADVLCHTRFRTDSIAIWSAIGALARRGLAKTVQPAVDEIKRFGEVHKALEPHIFHLALSNEALFSVAVQEKLELLQEAAPKLWAITGGKNPDPADPWLVAVASAYSYTLVTDEGPLSPNKIPAACRHPKIKARCISGPHFLFEAGIVTQMDPAHIDPHRFFGIDGTNG